MNIKVFDKIKKQHRNIDEKAESLLDIKKRDTIIENDYNLLELIASSNNEELRNFYFNEQTIPLISKQNNLAHILFKNNFYPNKIKLFDNELFLKYITEKNNTEYVIKGIEKEVKENEDQKLRNTLKNGLQKYIKYLKNDFDNNIENISIIMEKLPSKWYEDFLELIINNLKEYALKNKKIKCDEIFDNSYISDINFDKLESIINEFKGINNLYYSKELIYSLISKTNDYKNLIINKEQINRFQEYIHNNYCKKELLKNIKFKTLEELYLYFSIELLDYLLDDEGLTILEENNKFKELLENDIPYDKLTKSKLFANLLSKNYTNPKEYDEQIEKITNSYDNSSFNLLDNNIELQDYDHFYRIFRKLPSNKQLEYLKTNYEKILKINNENIFKGMKKEAYEIFKNNTNINNWYFKDYDLLLILQNKNEYSEEQLENIFNNPKNILTIANSKILDELYKMLLNLNNKKLNKIYTSNTFLTTLRNLNQLDKIYKITSEIKIDIRNIMLNKESLIDIGEEVLKEYKKDCINLEKTTQIKLESKYYKFINYTNRLKDKTLLFEILDFYLINEKYLSTFKILRDTLYKEDLENYLNSRKDLITKIIKQNNSDNIKFILGGLPYEIFIKEITKERENIILYCDAEEFYWIINKYYNENNKLNEKILCNDRFIEKYINYYGNIEKELKLVTDNEKLIKTILNKIKDYENMKKSILNNLNDNLEEFETYIKILMNSGVDVYNIEFLKDMIDVIFLNTRIKEITLKYEGQNLEKIKLKILNEIIKKSKESIAASITNPLNKNSIPLEYILDGKTILIPTIIYNKESYIFLVRRMKNGNHINNETHEEKIEYYSTITEKNRSMFYGDSGIKFGYIKINPEHIIQINSYDAIAQNPIGNKYIKAYIKYPEWVSMEELNERTLKKESYNEIRIKGKYIPDYVIAYDEPNEITLRYAYEHKTPMVKILRKSYPNAIEQCEDPYSNWN